MQNSPLYMQIKDFLLEKITSGQVQVEDKLPSEKELSEQFSVSRITVRKALTELEEEKYIYRAPGRGTFVMSQTPVQEANAFPGRAADAKMVGVIMCHLDSPFQIALFKAIESHLRQHGLQMCFGLSNGDIETEKQLIGRMQQQGIDGLVLYPVDGFFYNEKVLQLTIDGFPVVLVDRYLPGIDACCVYSDDHHGGFQIGEYLAGRGHKNVAVITMNPKQTICLINRIEGFCEGMMKNGVLQPNEQGLFDIVNSAVSNDKLQYEKNVGLIREYLEENPHISAFFCTTSVLALSAFSAVRQLGKSIEITCFDSIEDFEWTERYPIAYISHPESKLGHGAVAQLRKLMDGEKAENIVVPCSLVAPDAIGG